MSETVISEYIALPGVKIVSIRLDANAEGDVAVEFVRNSRRENRIRYYLTASAAIQAHKVLFEWEVVDGVLVIAHTHGTIPANTKLRIIHPWHMDFGSISVDATAYF